MKKSGLFISGTRSVRTVVIAGVLFMLSLYVSGNPALATRQQIALFRNTTTCVVMDAGMSFYNTPLKEAVQKYWKLTKYEFIDQDEFAKRKKDPKYSFIVMMDGAYDKDPGGVSYNYLSLVLGDPSGNLSRMPEFCSIPVVYFGDSDTDFEYVIPIAIKFMQIHFVNLEKDRLGISINGLRYYNKTGFKDKVLVFNKDRMAPSADSPDKIKAVCENRIKLLSVDEIQKEIESNPPNTLYHFHVGPVPGMGAGRCFEMLFDSDGNLYYYNFRKITNDNPDGFNLNDFRNIK